MIEHRIKVYFDEKTGTMRVQHECEVEVAGHKVRWSKFVDLHGPEVVIRLPELLAMLLSENKEEVEKEATRAAIQHVAAVSGRKTSDRVRQVTTGGTMKAEGDN